MRRRNNPIERTMMAIPTIIVVVIIGSTVLHLTRQTLLASLSKPSLSITPTWEPEIEAPQRWPEENIAPIPNILPDFPEDIVNVPNDIPKRPPVRNVITVQELSPAELTAQEELIDHLGGNEEFKGLVGDMDTAFSAAKRSLNSKGINMQDLPIVGIIDLTKPSYARRMAIYRPQTGEETRHLVSHGSNTGDLYATKFSNCEGSHQSSPGLFLIGKQYRGSHGASLRLHGLDPGINDTAFLRSIVMHSAHYVSYDSIMQNLKKEGIPRLGKSHGCPAVAKADLKYVLEHLVPGSYLYIYTGN